MLPLNHMAYHIPESDKPQDFEIQGTWGGAGFLLARVSSTVHIWGLGRREGKKMPTPSPVLLKKYILKLTLQAPPDFND